MRLLSFFIFFIFLLSCRKEVKNNVNGCPLVLLNDTDFNTIRTKLERPIDDSAAKREFIVSYRKDRWYLKDTKHQWENQYSEDYEGIVVKSYTKADVLIFCPYSAIAEGYKLFPHKFHDMYLLNRTNGSTIKHSSSQGLRNGTLRCNIPRSTQGPLRETLLKRTKQNLPVSIVFGTGRFRAAFGLYR